MVEDPGHQERVRESSDAVAAPAAPGAAQHVHREGPLEELGPAAVLCFGAGVRFGPALRLDAGVGVEGEAALFALALIRPGGVRVGGVEAGRRSGGLGPRVGHRKLCAIVATTPCAVCL